MSSAPIIQGMEESGMRESHLSSPAAFVEGGVQEACDDACSICLEDFCDGNPSTVTTCKHGFHLQCILEWCQRSSQCPMCWQLIVLKDPTSQELLEAVERERNIRVNSARNATLFHHPALGDFELQHLPIDGNDGELEERIFQHLAAAAAMGRTHHIVRREGHRGRSAAQGRPQFLVFSTHPNTPAGSVSASSPQRAEEDETVPAIAADSQLIPHSDTGEEYPHHLPNAVTGGQADQFVSVPSLASVTSSSRPALSNSRSNIGQSTAASNNRAGPSDFQAFSESLKSRFSAVSMRYKESITKSTRGWKERLFSRNSSMAELGSEVRREVNAGIASVSRMMERLDTRESIRPASSSASDDTEGHSSGEPRNERVIEDRTSISPPDCSKSASCATTSGESAPN